MFHNQILLHTSQVINFFMHLVNEAEKKRHEEVSIHY